MLFNDEDNDGKMMTTKVPQHNDKGNNNHSLKY